MNEKLKALYDKKGDNWIQGDFIQDNLILCPVCKSLLENNSCGGGRAREYCSNACKMKAYRQRRHKQELSEKNVTFADGVEVDVVLEKKFTVLSLGGGVQSTALALMAMHGLIEKPDYAIFADTGWEGSETLNHINELEKLLDY